MIKSALIYKFNKPFNATPESLDEDLSEFKFIPCGSQDISKFGFVSPLGKNGELFCHHASGITVITTMKEEKILPAQVIKEALEEKVETIEHEDGRNLAKKEKDALKDEIIMALLPRAFTKKTRLNFYILDLEFGKVIVADTSSPARAEEGLALIRKSLGTLPVIPLTVNETVESILTNHAKEESCFAGFEFDGMFDLRSDSDEGSTAKMQDFEVDCEEFKLHLANGKKIYNCSMLYGQSVSFKLDATLTFKCIKYSEEFRAQNDDIDDDDFECRFDADLVLALGEFSNLLENVVAGFGGVEGDL